MQKMTTITSSVIIFYGVHYELVHNHSIIDAHLITYMFSKVLYTDIVYIYCFMTSCKFNFSMKRNITSTLFVFRVCIVLMYECYDWQCFVRVFSTLFMYIFAILGIVVAV